MDKRDENLLNGKIFNLLGKLEIYIIEGKVEESIYLGEY